MRLRLLYSLMVFFALGGLSAQDTLGIVGSATPNGWDGPDLVMTEVADTVGLFEANVTLVDGQVKFRVNNDWAVNWGNDGGDFPTGIGFQGAGDISVFAGDYYVTLDTITGAYSFSIQSRVGLIGNAVPGTGWTEDVNMYEDSAGLFFLEIELLDSFAKFRLDDDWAVNWGADSFPTGIGSQGGDNIPVSKAGEYRITFDTATGAYNFEELITFSSIGIIGSATENGWDGPDVDLLNGNDANIWEGSIILGEGEIKFRANDEWELDWGGGAFPTDTAVFKSPDNIVVTPGEYLVSFNTETLVYRFTEVIDYESIGIIGTAVSDMGFDGDDVDMVRSVEDSTVWTLRTILLDGELKFRANDAWDTSWGAADFPSGVGEVNGFVNIPITAGEYQITFNSVTGEYNFLELVIYEFVSLIGPGTGAVDDNGGWNTDILMEKDEVDEQLWTLTHTFIDDLVKFRADTAWTVNWGSDAFDWPTGIGFQDQDNIPAIAGTYLVSLRTDSGEYGFQPPSSVHNESILKDIKVFPNPTDGLLNIELDSEWATGLINVEVLDVTGKKLISTSRQGNGIVRFDVSGLPSGTYYLKMFNKEFLVAKPISVK